MNLNRRTLFRLGAGAVAAYATGISAVKALIPKFRTWVPCEGQQIDRSQYSKLFEAVGTSFGSGDGATSFNLPDLSNHWMYDYQNQKWAKYEVDTGTGIIYLKAPTETIETV